MGALSPKDGEARRDRGKVLSGSPDGPPAPLHQARKGGPGREPRDPPTPGSGPVSPRLAEWGRGQCRALPGPPATTCVCVWGAPRCLLPPASSQETGKRGEVRPGAPSRHPPTLDPRAPRRRASRPLRAGAARGARVSGVRCPVSESRGRGPAGPVRAVVCSAARSPRGRVRRCPRRGPRQAAAFVALAGARASRAASRRAAPRLLRGSARGGSGDLR